MADSLSALVGVSSAERVLVYDLSGVMINEGPVSAAFTEHVMTSYGRIIQTPTDWHEAFSREPAVREALNSRQDINNRNYDVLFACMLSSALGMSPEESRTLLLQEDNGNFRPPFQALYNRATEAGVIHPMGTALQTGYTELSAKLKLSGKLSEVPNLGFDPDNPTFETFFKAGDTLHSLFLTENAIPVGDEKAIADVLNSATSGGNLALASTYTGARMQGEILARFLRNNGMAEVHVSETNAETPDGAKEVTLLTWTDEGGVRHAMPVLGVDALRDTFTSKGEHIRMAESMAKEAGANVPLELITDAKGDLELWKRQLAAGIIWTPAGVVTERQDEALRNGTPLKLDTAPLSARKIVDVLVPKGKPEPGWVGDMNPEQKAGEAQRVPLPERGALLVLDVEEMRRQMAAQTSGRRRNLV